MVGQTISHYKIIEKLGGGGMGVVYKAEDTKLKRIVALKFLPPSLTTDPDAKERFVHEAQAASALDHPTICTIHEINESDDGQLFIAMSYYAGETLKKKIEQGPLDIDLALDIAIQIANGLSRAHEAGIIHRDIKPANIIVTSRGEAKILDFGLAKLSGRTLLTKTGTTLGTAAYMSPEQARGEQVDGKSDIWSLGVVLYEMLAGQRPFESDYEQALVYSILNEAPRPLRELRVDVPETLEQIVGKAMAKNPQERYQTVEQLLSDLRVAQGTEETGGTIAGTEAVERKKRRRLIRQAIISLAAVAVILLGLFVVWPMVQDQLLASNPTTIAVIGFENQTGDKSQDHLRLVLQDAIITSLEQSKYIRVTTRGRMADILKQMGKKDVDYVDNELGLEICRREGAQLMAVGTFANAGELYRTTLKLVDVKTLETAKTYTTSGKGVESLLEKQIDDLSREVSRGIGVSERRTEETIRPMEEISTASLEAYQLYIRGGQELGKGYVADARPFLEMAVQKDSLFAAAWYLLGNVYGWDDRKAAEDAHNKARSLARRASEKERFMIAWNDSSLRATLLGLPSLTNLQFLKLRTERFPREKEFLTDWANALLYALRNTDEAIQVYKRVLELDPTYGYALNNLAYAYCEKEDWEKAIETLKRYAVALPGDANPYDSMGDIYMEKRMYDEAIASYKQALAVKSNWPMSAEHIMWYNFRKEDYGTALQWVDTAAARGKELPYQERQMWMRALVALWQGRLGEAEKLLARCEAMLSNAGQHVDHGLDFLDIWIACERQQFVRSRRALNSWAARYEEEAPTEYRRIPELFVQMCNGFIDIKEGRMDSAAIRLAAMDSIRAQLPPSDTTHAARLIISYYRNYSSLLRSEWLMAAGRSQEALAAVPRGTPHDLASRPCWAWHFHTGDVPTFIPVMVDVLPRAYLALGQLDSSVAAYERAVSFDADPDSPILPRYHYRLAQVYERKGLNAKAIGEYEKFLKIWGKADPIYKEPGDARVRLAKLRRQGM
jgi:serine/threonine protein kinase/Tfp pilus assembly protein PilF